MTVHAAPVPVLIDNLSDVDAWCVRKIADYRMDLDEDEIAASIGARGRAMSAARIALLEDLRLLIADALVIEQAERDIVSAEQAGEAAWRDAYPDADELTLRRLAGDR